MFFEDKLIYNIRKCVIETIFIITSKTFKAKATAIYLTEVIIKKYIR